MKLNTRTPIFSGTTHEGAPARRISKLQELTRSVMACFLWEKEAYESGEDIATRIQNLIAEIHDTKSIYALTVAAREDMKLRHVPLLMARAMAKSDMHKHVVCNLLERIIQRADELAEFLAIYWKNGRCPVSAQVKKGLAAAFRKFNAYQLAKYNREGAVKLRDVLFLCHPKPASDEQQDTWNELVASTLNPPDTWEVALSAGKDKHLTWLRLLAENKLGALALLRNLRNMQEAQVSASVIRRAIADMDVSRVLPFRFIAASRYAPGFEPELETAMLRCTETMPKLAGHTVILVDVSGSMNSALSAKSDMRRIDAACGVAMVARELCEECTVYSFSELCIQIPARRGMALRDAINNSQLHSGTYLGNALKQIHTSNSYDRIIVITDEQSADPVPNPKGLGYMINVAALKRGVGYGPWLHIDGFSENVIRYISEFEKSLQLKD